MIWIHDNDGGIAFFGETGLSANFCIYQHLALRADYRCIWIDGVALASEQLGSSSLLTFDGMNRGGSIFYHGLYVGVDISF